MTVSDDGKTATETDASNLLLNVRLIERDKGIAPGQFAAFYEGDVCLGSGVISDTSPSF